MEADVDLVHCNLKFTKNNSHRESQVYISYSTRQVILKIIWPSKLGKNLGLLYQSTKNFYFLLITVLHRLPKSIPVINGIYSTEQKESMSKLDLFVAGQNSLSMVSN